MKNLMTAIIALAFMAGCSGQMRDLVQVPSVDPAPKVDQASLCQDEIDKMIAAFDAATIANKVIEIFFADAVEECEGVDLDYILPIAQLINQNTSACGCDASIKAAIKSALDDAGNEFKFNEKMTFTSGGFCVLPSVCLGGGITVDPVDPIDIER